MRAGLSSPAFDELRTEPRGGEVSRSEWSGALPAASSENKEPNRRFSVFGVFFGGGECLGGGVVPSNQTAKTSKSPPFFFLGGGPVRPKKVLSPIGPETENTT